MKKLKWFVRAVKERRVYVSQPCDATCMVDILASKAMPIQA